jgi:cysteine-rich repeat protein
VDRARFGIRTLAIIGAAIPLLGADPAAAAETPVAAKVLALRDGRDPRGPKLVFESALSPSPAGDPRTEGATFEVVGNGVGEGGTGIIALHAARWTGLGSPPGSEGWEYRDPGATDGVRRVVLRPGAGEARLRVIGGGPAMPFEIRQPHGPLDVRFRVGADAWCARATSFVHNVAGWILARDVPAPAGCPAAATRCGNRRLEPGEDCDDGGATAGDGCSPECALESAAGLCAGVARSPHDRAALALVASGLGSVTHVASAPLDPTRLFVAQQAGRIDVVRDGSVLPQPFLELLPGTDISVGSERGLLSVAFHPGYASNRRFFVFYNDVQGRLVIARYEASTDPDRADPTSRRIVLRQRHPRGNHNGGQLAFGPDGYLYAGFGDGGGAGDPDEKAQDPATLLGKLLRIDVDVEGRPRRRVPPTNPFAAAGPRLGLVWALGLRNPWRFSFDRLTGDLYIGDVGQGSREEIDFEPAGSAGGMNFGWDVFEGSSCFDPAPHFASCSAADGLVGPVLEYAHAAVAPEASGCSVTGGFVYRGCRLEGLRGEYFYSDFCTRFLRTFRGVAGGVAVAPRDRTAELAPAGAAVGNVTTFGEDSRGELYVGDQSGQVFVLAPSE